MEDTRGGLRGGELTVQWLEEASFKEELKVVGRELVDGALVDMVA